MARKALMLQLKTQICFSGHLTLVLQSDVTFGSREFSCCAKETKFWPMILVRQLGVFKFVYSISNVYILFLSCDVRGDGCVREKLIMGIKCNNRRLEESLRFLRRSQERRGVSKQLLCCFFFKSRHQDY